LKSRNRYSASSIAWDKKAGVRNNPEAYDLRLPTDGDTAGTERSWHLPTYAGILKHPALRGLTDSQREYVKGTQLLEFVSKQTRFEVDYVNLAASKLAHGKYNFEMPEQLKLDALKIYTDEAYHAYYTQKIANQIRAHFKVGQGDIDEHVGDFYTKTESTFASVAVEHRPLAILAFVITGENQIVSDISEQMKGIVFEPVRAMFRDHMRDEVFHAQFFSKVFEHCWPQLTPPEKEAMGLSFGSALEVLAAPRTSIYYFSLGSLGYSQREIASFIKDTYETEEWRTTRVVDRMKPTLDMLQEHGVFKLSAVSKEFKRKQYI
jgi:hypothetical protein